MVQLSSDRMQRGSDGSALACCKAARGSNLSPAPHEGHCLLSNRNEDFPEDLGDFFLGGGGFSIKFHSFHQKDQQSSDGQGGGRAAPRFVC